MKRGPLAAKLCAQPNYIKQQKCGLMSEDEFQAVYAGIPVYAGTMYNVMPVGKKLPDDISVGNSFQYFRAPIALGCQGKVLVRAVMKIVKQPKWWLTVSGVRLVPTDTSSKVVRCFLELPKGEGSEYERVLKSKETKCYVCERGDKNTGCPSQEGAWFSDVYITQLDGCGFDRSKGFNLPLADLAVNPGYTAIVAKFEVCNDAGCFNQAYEEKKIANALPCSEQKCD